MAEAAKKGGKMGLIVGAALAVALGGAGFFLVYSGVIPTPEKAPAPVEKADAPAPAEAPQPVEFAQLEPIVITLGAGAQLRQLQFVGHLEIEPGKRDAVAAVQPRVRDALNTYLRAVSPDDVEDPAALLRMRAQMLRRVQVVAGEGVVRDLLVSEFILR
jgi:flagellar FliL protein